MKASSYFIITSNFIGSNLQEASTSKEAPTPINFLHATSHIRLLPQQTITCSLSSYNLKGDYNPLTQHETKMLIYLDISSVILLHLCLFNLHIYFISAPDMHNISISSLLFFHSPNFCSSLTFFHSLPLCRFLTFICTLILHLLYR